LIWTGMTFDVTAMHVADEDVTKVPDVIAQEP